MTPEPHQPDTSSYPFVDRRRPSDCKHEGVIQTLLHSRDAAQKTLEGVSTKLDLILAQITRVAILEEKHSNSAADITRAHDKIAVVEQELETLSREVRDYMAYSRGVTRTAWAIWTLMGSGLGAMLLKILFFSNGH